MAANDQSKTGSLAQQGQCAKQAKAAWDATGLTDRDLASYQNHYNVRLNKCFVLLGSRLVNGQRSTDNKNVFDAYEKKDFASYIWQTDGTKPYTEIPPVICYIKRISGEKQKCSPEKNLAS